MIADMHVHTVFSCDSETDMEEYVNSAKAKNVDVICFTDHVDLNKNDYGYQYYNPVAFFEKYNTMKSNLLTNHYENKVKLFAGMEFGEPHLYSDTLEQLSAYPYDFIIGSIHWIGDIFPCQKVREKYSVKEFFTLYWQEVLKTVKQGGFDALGHMDFPKRYYGELYYNEQMMSEILKYLLDKDGILEINTSSLRKNLQQTMPGKELLQMYRDHGGKYVTIGSDAHEAKDLAADNENAKSLISDLGLQEVIYIERKRIVTGK